MRDTFASGGIMERAKIRRRVSWIFGQAVVSALLVIMCSTFEPSIAAAQDTDTSASTTKLPNNPFADDPIHQAALKESANHKIVFVLGKGFGKRPLRVLRKDLAELGLIEHKHYEMLTGAASPKEGGVAYVGGEMIRLQTTTRPLIFDQYATENIVLALKSLLKRGYLILSQ